MSMKRRAREKFRGPKTPTERRRHWSWTLRAYVCLEKLDWKGVPSKGNSRSKSREGTSSQIFRKWWMSGLVWPD